MARQLVVLALIVVAIVGSVSAEGPSAAPATAPVASSSPKAPVAAPKASAAAPQASASAPVSATPEGSIAGSPYSEGPAASSPGFDLASPPAPGSEASEGPIADDGSAAPSVAPVPAKNGASTLKVSAVAGVAVVAGSFLF